MEEKVKTFLDEGYDFIEESCFGEPLTYTELDEISINESQNVKSPYKIIGRLAGMFAPVGGFSRNNRYYPESHWKTVLESAEVQRRLKGREMLGMIGHEDSRVGDNQIREGLISHVVSCLEIREDKNGKPFLYGEMDILDTPAGRILKAMHEGGAGLYVSSRGAGKLLDTPGKPYKTVSPQFFLETWDVVARPGFMEAKPVFEQVEREVPKPQIHESEQVTSESSEVKELKSQIDKLAKIVEKVVDDVYEEVQEQPIAKPEAVDEPLKTEEIKNEKPMEMGKASVEEALADSDDDYEFKVVRKNALANPNLYGGRYTQKDVKEARKQYIEDTQKKKEANEALANFVSLMADTNISEEAFEEIIDMIAKAKKEN